MRHRLQARASKKPWGGNNNHGMLDTLARLHPPVAAARRLDGILTDVPTLPPYFMTHKPSSAPNTSLAVYGRLLSL